MAYYNQYSNFYPQQIQPNNYQMQSQQQQIQSGGFIPVPSEDVARNYPVAPGNSITFKNENAPYVYTKTMGFSQLDRPIFEKYKLVREEDAPESTQTAQIDHIDTKAIDTAIDKLNGEIEAIWSEISGIKEQTKKPTTKRVKDGDD